MADSDKTVEYAITADPSGFNAGMQQATVAAQQAAQQIQLSFKALQDSMMALSNAFSAVTGMLGALTAVMAGGAAFKDVIGASVAWTGEAKKVATQMGVTTERASVMMVAMRHLGIDSDTLTMAAGKMSKQIATNGAAFETLGVKVKDANGQYRPTLDIMADVNDKLKAIKNPIEQNIAGTQIYGKSWNDVRGIMRLTSDEIKNAEQKTKDLGLVVGDEAVAQARQYKESMNDMKLVMTSLEVQLGSALMPAFVKLGGWLSSAGPIAAKGMGMVLDSFCNIMQTLGEAVMDVWNVVSDGFRAIGGLISSVMGGEAPNAMGIFGNALKVIEIAFVGFKVGVQVVLEAVIAIIDIAIAYMMRLASVAAAALSGDWAGAKAAWATGTKQIEDVQQQHVDKLVKIAQAGQDKIDEIAMRGPKQGQEIKDKKTGGGPSYDFAKAGKDSKDKSRIQEWEAKLEADKDGYAKEQALAGTAREYSVQQEADYWKNVLDTVTMSVQEKAQVEKKYYAAESTLRKEAFDQEVAGEKASMENFKNNHVARQAIAQKIYDENVARFGAESKEAKAAMADVLKEKRAQADQIIAVEKVVQEQQRTVELTAIDQAEQDAQNAVTMHKMTEEQLLAQQKQFEDQRYQIKAAALRDEQALLKGSDQDPVAVAKLDAQMETLEQQHQAKLAAIRQKEVAQQQQITDQMYSSIKSGMTNVVEGAMNGSIKMSNVLQSMMQVVSQAVINMITQTTEKWITDLLLTDTTSKTSALGQITTNAGVAGSAATASAAAIPLIGWMLAPEAGIAASAAAMAFAPMASAAGGYDIPAGLNPIVQTHAKEMILPAKYADLIRGMADGGGGGGGAGGSGPTIHYHDHTGTLSHAAIRTNIGVIAKALRDYSKKS